MPSPHLASSPRRFFLAIRHKPSGGFLPQMTSYGFTRAEPTLEEPPRLFARPGAAKQALARWLEGAHYEIGGESESGEQRIRVIHNPSRKKSEMEIVEIELIVRSLSEAQLARL